MCALAASSLNRIHQQKQAKNNRKNVLLTSLFDNDRKALFDQIGDRFRGLTDAVFTGQVFLDDANGQLVVRHAVKERGCSASLVQKGVGRRFLHFVLFLGNGGEPNRWRGGNQRGRGTNQGRGSVQGRKRLHLVKQGRPHGERQDCRRRKLHGDEYGVLFDRVLVRGIDFQSPRCWLFLQCETFQRSPQG